MLRVILLLFRGLFVRSITLQLMNIKQVMVTPQAITASTKIFSLTTVNSIFTTYPMASQTRFLRVKSKQIFPWGDPANRRDVTLGINAELNGFGGPYNNGAFMLFDDGRVKHISEKIDPEILKALSTPAGGEVISQNSY